MKCIVIGGTRTGVGKTATALALAKGLSNAGYKVQSFKVGPGFVDARRHEKVTGRPCYNLDAFLMGEDGIRRELAKAKADVAIIEGASGLFTGASSTARIAGLLKVPIILTVDASASSESVAATVLGFVEYASRTQSDARIVGVVATRVGSEKHINDVRSALERIGTPLMGVLRKDVWERNGYASETYEEEQTEKQLLAVYNDLDVASIIRSAAELGASAPASAAVHDARPAVGIPLDVAFCFYYRSNIEALERFVRVKYFSPLTERLPSVDGLYIGGGFPEAHAQRLSENTTLLRELRARAEEGMPVWAEGGGLLYLSRSLITCEGAMHKLAGIVPAEVRMTDQLQGLGHSEVEIVFDCPIAGRGDRLRGNEFHYSVVDPDRDVRFAYKMIRGTGIDGFDGIVEYNVLASQQHVHVYSMRHGFDEFIDVVRGYART
ncbi:MAG TPA: cobyrinate a,c-diamide synthase [Candidatus Bathyarchaeia archaeon]|nr:cobyrinate a,c-diamide synthase [Candidatus Bathyarchaeia archaeon]